MNDTVLNNPFTAPIQGTLADLTGTDGKFVFTVTITNEGNHDIEDAPRTTERLVLNIIAEPYDNTQDNLDIAAAKAAIEGAVYSATQATASNVSAAKTVATAKIATLVTNGVTTEIAGEVFTAAVTGTVPDLDGTNGQYLFAVNLSKGAGTPLTTTTKIMAITATPYDATQDNADITAAKPIIIDKVFSTTQVIAPDAAKAKIEAERILGTLSLAAQTKVVGLDFTTAVIGSVANPAGINGSYEFRIEISQGAGTTATINKTMAITATKYDPAQDNADIAATNTTITGKAFSTTQVIAPDAAKAKIEAERIITTLSLPAKTKIIEKGFTAAISGNAANTAGTNGSYGFNIEISKGAGTTVTINKVMAITATAYNPAQDNADIAAANTAIIGKVFTTTQENAPNIDMAEKEVEKILGTLNLAADIKVVDVSFTSAKSGSTTNLAGTNGSYQFNVVLSKGAGTPVTTATKTMTITATAYNPAQDNADILDAKNLIDNKDFTVTQLIAPNIAETEDALDSIVAELIKNGVDAEVTGGEFVPAVSGDADNLYGENGSFEFSVELSKGDGTPVTAGPKLMTIVATVYNPEQDNIDITNAKNLIEDNDFTVTQVIASDENNAIAAVDSIIADLVHNGVSVKIEPVRYVAPIAGTRDNPKGIDGEFEFKVIIEKNNGSPQITKTIIMVIKATPYTSNVKISVPGHDGEAELIDNVIVFLEEYCDLDHITVKIEIDGKVIFDGDIPLTLGENNPTVGDGYSVKITNNRPFEELVKSRWNDNTLTIIHNENIQSFVWYIDGVAQNITDRSVSADANGTPLSGKYSVKLLMKDGTTMGTCEYTANEQITEIVEPMILRNGNIFTAEIKNYEGAKVEVYNTIGDKIATFKVKAGTTRIDSKLAVIGHLFVLTDKEGNRKIMKKVMVK